MLTHLDGKNFNAFIKENKKVVVDFYATWCGPCRAMAPVFDAVAENVSNFKFAKVDVDKAEELALSYGINTIPTIAIFENGALVEKSSGYKTQEQLMDLIGV